MKQPDRNRWRITLAATIATVGVLIGGATAYWQYVNYVPPFRPPLPKLPSPNGYVQATHILERLSQAHRPPLPKNWPRGTTAELQAQVAVARPFLDEIRRTFRQEWRQPALLTGQSFEDAEPIGRRIRHCAWDLAAESMLARRRGDYSAAMQSSLDAMELGAQTAHGSVLLGWLTSIACASIGLREAEQTVLRLSLEDARGALTRTRRIDSEWPAVTEMLECDRNFSIGEETDLFQQLERVPLSKKLKAIDSMYRDWAGNRWDTCKRALTPRVLVLRHTDQYFLDLIQQSTRPVRQRVHVDRADDAWSGLVFPIDLAEESFRLEGTHTRLALLEVALAVRVHFLEHGRYPARLTEISRKWLPAIPVDLWDQPIAYCLKGGHPVIYSLGPDGKDDGGTPTGPGQLTPATRGDLVFGHLFPPRPRK